MLNEKESCVREIHVDIRLIICFLDYQHFHKSCFWSAYVLALSTASQPSLFWTPCVHLTFLASLYCSLVSMILLSSWLFLFFWSLILCPWWPIFFLLLNGNIACLVRKISVYFPCTSGQSGKEDRKVRKFSPVPVLLDYLLLWLRH